MFTKLSHVELIVKSLDEMTQTYDKLFGLKPSSPIMNLTDGGVKARVFPLGGDCSLAVSEPTDPSSNAAKILEKRGEGVFLLAIEVDDLDRQIDHLKESGVQVTVGTLAPGLPKVCWVHPRHTNGVLIELIPPGFLNEVTRRSEKID